jgi:hypothetical protein
MIRSLAKLLFIVGAAALVLTVVCFASPDVQQLWACKVYGESC